MERACSLVTAVRFLTAKNGVDYKFSLHFLPSLWYTCLRNKCHAISTICLQLRESVGYRYRRCVLCLYLEEALTHTVTHTTKRVDGNSGEDRAYLPQYTELKASKSLKKQQAECPDTLRNQQVVCSSHITSSRNALWSLAAGHFCTLPLDAAAGARYNKVYIEPFGTALLFSY